MKASLRTITLTYPEFRALSPGIQRMLVMTELLFCGQRSDVTDALQSALRLSLPRRKNARRRPTFSSPDWLN